MTFGVAVLGTGRIGGGYVDVSKETPGARMVVVAEPREEQVAPLKEKHPDVEFVADFREAINRDDVDIVICTLPHWLHKDAAIEAARAGKHVYTEKPTAAWLADGEEMMGEAQKAGVKLMTAHTQRYFPSVIAIQEIIRSGRFGKPIMAHDIWHFDYRPQVRPPWMLDRKFGGGMGLMAVIHQLDRLLWFFGDDVLSVTARVGALTHPEQDKSDDSAMYFLRWKNGMVATLSMCAWRGGATEYGGDVFFENGMAKFRISYGGEGDDTGVWVADSKKGEWTFEPVPETNSFQDEFSAFIKSLERGDEDTPVPQQYGLRILKILEAAEESSRTQQEIFID